MTQENKIQEIKEKFENRFSVLQAELSRELEALKEAGDRSDSSSDLSSFATYLRQLKQSYTQTELLNSLLDILSNLAPRAMLLIVKDDTLFGWAARGFEADFLDKKIKQVKWRVSQYPELVRAVKKHEFFDASYSDLSDISESISSFDDFSPVKSAFMPIMVRNKVAGVLYIDSGDTMELNHLGAVEMLVHVGSMELTMITTKLKKKEVATPEPTPEPVVEPVIPKPVAPPEPEVHEPATEVSDLPVAPDFGPPVEESIEDSFEDKPEPVTETPSHAEYTKEEKKAQRVARVLISDLILYNETKVVEGRRSGGLYGLLKEDIDRSYEHYLSRVKGTIPENPNFFKKELITQLAEGQESLLGDLPF